MRVGSQRGQHVLHIQAGRLHDGLLEGPAVQGGRQIARSTLDALAHQAEAVGVHTTGCQTQHHVAGFYIGTGQNFGLFDRADGKTGQVVFTGGVHAGHFGSFAANQGAAREFTTLGDAANDRRSGVYVEFAAGEVVQEEQGLGTLHQNIIDTHGHQVDTHGVVHIPLKRQLELGAHAVGAAHQHGFLVALGYFKQCAKAANAGQNAFPHGLFCQRLDALNQGVASVNINAGIFVGKGCGRARMGHGVGQTGLLGLSPIEFAQILTSTWQVLWTIVTLR